VIVVGIDVSLRATGLAIRDTVLEVTTTGRVVAPALGDDVLAVRNRIRRCVDGVLRWMPPRVDLVVIEHPIPATSGYASMQLERAAAYWILVDQLVARCPVAAVHPRTRAKLATGNGNASKAAVLAAMRETFPQVNIPDDNVADAVALVEAGARRVGYGTVLYSPEQMSAFAKVAWPRIEGKQ
jgi:Holliday junction resolvasome RuvABC endonuclease subunit